MIPRHGYLAAAMLLPMPAQANAQAVETERVLQTALERLQSGISMTSQLTTGAALSVRALRTWKSVTGHYCREYETRLVAAGSQPVRSTGVRCRDADGVWKTVEVK